MRLPASIRPTDSDTHDSDTHDSDMHDSDMHDSDTHDADTKLMLRVQGGDLECFSQLVGRNRAMVVRVLSQMVRNPAIAEELTQDVFIRVYRAREKYSAEAKFSTWLYRIATNVALNYFRDTKRIRNNVSLDTEEGAAVRRKAADCVMSVEDRLVRDAAAGRIHAAIRTLPARQRAVVVMHRYDEMDYAEIARTLGCSVLAVKSLMFRASEALRMRLAA